MLNEVEKKQKMQLLNIKIRNSSFLEVGMGLSPAQAVAEAKRCMNCKDKTCVSGCPLNVNIPSFIAEVEKGNFEKAYEIVLEKNFMPASCSRVCSANPKCERKCSLSSTGEAVAIAALERFVADYHKFNEHDDDDDLENEDVNELELEHENEHKNEPENELKTEKGEIVKSGHKVAIIGSGPAGLTCASALADLGYEITVFEKRSLEGGRLDYAVPRFRLPREILERDIEKLKMCGVTIITGSSVGREEAEKLINVHGFDAVYVSECSELPLKLNINGEDLKGVISADSFISWLYAKEINKFYVDAPYVKGTKTVVFGSGLEALDVARCIRRFGAEVTFICPKPETEIDVSSDEIVRAKEEDIKLLFLTNIVEFSKSKDGQVAGVFCEQLMETNVPGSSSAELLPLYDSEFEIPADVVIVSNNSVKENCGNPNDLKGIFCFNGDNCAVSAMAVGKNDAELIDRFVRNSTQV